MVLCLVLMFTLISCEPSHESNNSYKKPKITCNKPKEKTEEKEIDAGTLYRGGGGTLGGIIIQHADIRSTYDTHIRHFKDKHGTKWSEKRQGRIRVIYDEQENLLFYVGKRLVKKHRNVKLKVVTNSRLNEKYCKYQEERENSIYSSNGKSILFISRVHSYLNDGRPYNSTTSLSYYPNGNDIGYSTSL